MKPVRLMLIDAAASTPHYLPLDLIHGGASTVVEHAASAQAIELTLRCFEPDLIVSEFSVAALQDMQALELLRQRWVDAPLIVVIEEHNEPLELETLRAGAFDCVPRNDKARLLAAMMHALNLTHERRFR